jgi:hypothetical protein
MSGRLIVSKSRSYEQLEQSGSGGMDQTEKLINILRASPTLMRVLAIARALHLLRRWPELIVDCG